MKTGPGRLSAVEATPLACLGHLWVSAKWRVPAKGSACLSNGARTCRMERVPAKWRSQSVPAERRAQHLSNGARNVSASLHHDNRTFASLHVHSASMQLNGSMVRVCLCPVFKSPLAVSFVVAGGAMVSSFFSR